MKAKFPAVALIVSSIVAESSIVRINIIPVAAELRTATVSAVVFCMTAMKLSPTELLTLIAQSPLASDVPVKMVNTPLFFILISMSALAAAVPLMCVPFILRIAGPTNSVGAPVEPKEGTLKSEKSQTP